MKILNLSDTHGAHRRLGELSAADVVVQSGDFTMAGSGAVGFHCLVKRVVVSREGVAARGFVNGRGPQAAAQREG